MVLIGARRSSPCIAELRYDWDVLFRDEEDWILPVNGARSDCSGSSRSSMVARVNTLDLKILLRRLVIYHHLDL